MWFHCPNLTYLSCDHKVFKYQLQIEGLIIPATAARNRFKFIFTKTRDKIAKDAQKIVQKATIYFRYT